MQGWDAPLRSLLAQGKLTGYALLDHRSGGCLSTCGDLQVLWGDGQQPSSACQDLWALFHTSERPAEKDVACCPPPLPAPFLAFAASHSWLGVLQPSTEATSQDHLDLCGQHALVVQRSDSSVYAGGLLSGA